MKFVKPVINEYCKQSQLRELESSNSPSFTLADARAQCKDVLNRVGREPVPGDPNFERYLGAQMDIIARMLHAGQEEAARQAYANTSAFFQAEYGVQVPPFPTLEKS